MSKENIKWYKVPPSPDPALKGLAVLRKPWKAGARMENETELNKGIRLGQPVKIPRYRQGYFTETPEPVDMSDKARKRFVRRAVIDGSLVEVDEPSETPEPAPNPLFDRPDPTEEPKEVKPPAAE